MKETFSALMNTYTKDKYKLLFDVKNGNKTKEEFKEDVMNHLHQYYSEEETEENMEMIAKQLMENLFGYSIIEPLIKDNSITDIKIINANTIIAKRLGEYFVSDIKFENDEQHKRFIDSVKSKNNISGSTADAVSKFDDKETSDMFVLRFTFINPLLVQDETPVLVIRKFPKRPYTIDELIELKVMTPEVAEYLKNIWERGSLLVCGAPSGGKSTILNCLKEYIPEKYSTLVLQEADELTRYKNRNMVFLHCVNGNSESDLHYTLADLTIAGLTFDISHCIIGEIKGKEARYLLNASFTGLTCGGTVHSNSANQALDKVVDYALMGENVYSKEELLEMLSSFKTIIFMKNFKVWEIDEVVGFNEDRGRLEYKPVFRVSK